MIAYSIYAFRKKDEPDPLFGGVSGTLKQDWARTGLIDFHVVAIEITSPQQSFSESRKKRQSKIRWGQEVTQLRWRLATVEEAKEVVACWNAHAAKTR
jgi:hypothetical protein